MEGASEASANVFKVVEKRFTTAHWFRSKKYAAKMVNF